VVFLQRVKGETSTTTKDLVQPQLEKFGKEKKQQTQDSLGVDEGFPWS